MIYRFVYTQYMRNIRKNNRVRASIWRTLFDGIALAKGN